MKSKRKTSNALCIIASILFVMLLFVPESKNRFLLAGMGITGLFIVAGSLILPVFPRLTRKLSYHRTKECQKPWTWLKNTEPVTDAEKLLWRQISYQITDKLQAAFPDATWEFQKHPSMEQLLKGCTIRLRTFHTEDYNFAEVRMNPYGYLELQMLTISSLKKSMEPSEEGTTPEADPESWYALIGKVKLENLIGQLHAKGHKKLYINESGQIYIQNGDTPEIKDHFDYFPPRNYWDVLITLFQKEDLTAKETDQALELSWIKE